MRFSRQHTFAHILGLLIMIGVLSILAGCAAVRLPQSRISQTAVTLTSTPPADNIAATADPRNAAFYTPGPTVAAAQLITATTTTVTLYVEDLVKRHTPSYRGITPGRSRRSDVLAQWGMPNVIRTYRDFESLHYFSGIGNRAQEAVLLERGIVRGVTTWHLQLQSRLGSFRGDLSDEYIYDQAAILARALGMPQTITPTLALEYPIHAFLDYGLALEYGWRGYVYQFFVPSSQPEYEAIWGHLPLDIDPFPLIPSVDEAGIQPGRTTRTQLAQALGNPDYIVYNDPNTPWVYFVEPDLLGSMYITFDQAGIVAGIDIESGHRLPTLGDVVTRYGPPQLVERGDAQPGEDFAALWLIYAEKGMGVMTVCSIPACPPAESQMLVSRKWYFPPQSPEAYQAASNGSVFSVWQGFAP